MDYSKLQNGSDIRGIAIAVPGGKEANLTEESCTNIGSAFAKWTAAKLGKPINELRIAIGRDSRLTGAEIASWLTDGITLVGANAYDGGMASTPAMFMCCVNELHFDAGIMVTASHLPMERNGMKFFIASGGLEKQDISAILASAANGVFTAVCERGACGKVDIMTPYSDGLKAKILGDLGLDENAKPFTGFRIVVDAGNGAGGFFA